MRNPVSFACQFFFHYLQAERREAHSKLIGMTTHFSSRVEASLEGSELLGDALFALAERVALDT